MDKMDTDIVEVIKSDGIELRWNGKNWFGCCPFHDEKTASFSVSPQKQIFHCFGCGIGGDVIEYVQKRNNVDFKGALKILGLFKQKLTRSERMKISKQKEISQKRREKKERFETWCLWYLDELIGKRDTLKEASKALTHENFDKYCGILSGLGQIENEIDIMCFGERSDIIKLYGLKGGAAGKPYDYDFYIALSRAYNSLLRGNK